MISFHCHGCGKVVPKSTIKRGRCPSCATERERARVAKHPRDRSYAAKKQREEILEKYGHRCTALIDGIRCEEVDRLEVHHINGDQADDRSHNKVPLCPPHHRLLQYDPDAEFAMPGPGRGPLAPIGGVL